MNAEIKPIKTAAEPGLAAAYQVAKKRLPGGPAFARLREQALAAFVEGGLPHRRIEEWKYTDLRTLLREAAPLADPPDKATFARAKKLEPLPSVDVRRVTLINGSFVGELSDLVQPEAGLTILPLSRALAEGHALASRIGRLLPPYYDATLALNTAFVADGIVIGLAAGSKLARPIHVRHLFTGAAAAAAYARTLVVVGEGAIATVIESFEGPDGVAYQSNTTAELQVGDKAWLEYVRVQAEGDAAIHLATVLADIGASAKLHTCSLTVGAAVSRQSVFLRCTGAASETRLSGATLLRRKQHADTTLYVDHMTQGCSSREMFKSALDDESRGVFQGKIVVRPGAQKTDAKMMSAALLLGAAAEADHKPELEIFADDVQCGHGATAGALDEELLFYLRARGIPRKEAEALLIRAFIGEAMEAVPHEALREALLARAADWLAAREHAA
jgi:Fe-S cluster assembly protein SufD